MTLPSLAPIPQALATACRRFPLLLLAASVATLAVISFTHSESEVFMGHALRVTLAALFAFPALLASGFAAEWMPRGRWVFQAFALAATVAVWTMLPADKPFPLFFQRWALLVFAAMAVASAVPGLAVSPPGNWWRVNVGILNAVVLAGLFTAVILLGLQLALVSLNALFALQLNHQFYVDVFSVCSLFVAPLAVLALLPPAREALNLDQPGFAVWGRFCQWALLPLGFLLSLIHI